MEITSALKADMNDNKANSLVNFNDLSIKNGIIYNLLSLSAQFTSIKDKSEMSSLIKAYFKDLFYFSNFNVIIFNSATAAYKVFAVDEETGAKDKTQYEVLFNYCAEIFDKPMQSVFGSGQPVISELNESFLNSFKEPLDILFVYKNVQMVSLPLDNHDGTFGVINFFADKTGSFSNANLPIIQTIAKLVSIAVTNITTQEQLKKREQERKILLQLSEKLLIIRNKNEMIDLVNSRLKEIFQFTHSIISLVNDDLLTYSNFITDPQSRNISNKNYKKHVFGSHPIDDGVVNQVRDAEKPVVFNIEELISSGISPGYLKMNYESGSKELFVIPLKSEGNSFFGLMAFFSDVINGVDKHSVNFLQGVSYQLSMAVLNIISREEIEQREREKTILLSLSNDIAAIRDKNDLFEVVSTKIRALLSSQVFIISLIEEDKTKHSIFFVDHEEIALAYPEYQEVKKKSGGEVNDGVFNLVLASKEPIIFDIPGMVKAGQTTNYLMMWHKMGRKEMVAVALKRGEENIGTLFYYTEQKINKNLVKGIGAQISVAISNILDNEILQRKEEEKSKLLSFSNELAAIRDKKGLASVINLYLKTLFLVKEYMLSVKNSDDKTSSFFLWDESAYYTTAPGFDKIISTKNPITSGPSEIVYNSSEPVYFDLAEIFEKKQLDFPSAPFWLSVNIKKLCAVRLRVGNENIGTIFLLPDQLNDHLLMGISSQIAIAVANILANEKIESQFQEINEYRQQLEEENQYLQGEIVSKLNDSEIIGDGVEMQKVYQLLSQVAFANSTVLLLGVEILMNQTT